MTIQQKKTENVELLKKSKGNINDSIPVLKDSSNDSLKLIVKNRMK